MVYLAHKLGQFKIYVTLNDRRSSFFSTTSDFCLKLHSKAVVLLYEEQPVKAATILPFRGEGNQWRTINDLFCPIKDIHTGACECVYVDAFNSLLCRSQVRGR